jgi:hypothetical protein
VTIGVELAKKLGMQNPDHRRNYGLTVVCGGSLACEETIVRAGESSRRRVR